MSSNETIKTPLLEAKNITAGYGFVDVLFDVNIKLYKGEFIVIIGPNGAGKTTLMRTISGVINPNKGNIIHNGKNITGLKPSEILTKGISYVPQEGNIFTDLSVIDNLEMGAYIYEGDYEERLDMVFSLFPILKERKNQKAGNLSGGQRQMLAISRGVMVNPKILMLDEPTSGLQPSLVTEVLHSIVKLKKEEELTIIMVAQTEKAIPEADRGYLMRSGEIVLEENTDTLLESEQISQLYFGG